jgi:hypothetical protein
VLGEPGLPLHTAKGGILPEYLKKIDMKLDFIQNNMDKELSK